MLLRKCMEQGIVRTLHWWTSGGQTTLLWTHSTAACSSRACEGAWFVRFFKNVSLSMRHFEVLIKGHTACLEFVSAKCETRRIYLSLKRQLARMHIDPPQTCKDSAYAVLCPPNNGIPRLCLQRATLAYVNSCCRVLTQPRTSRRV